MNIFTLIANIINKILSFSLFNSIPSLPSISLPGSETKDIERNTKGDFDNGDPRRGLPSGNRCQITNPEQINPLARFHSTGSAAWVNQFKGTDMEGQHGGTDFLAPVGANVYAPWDMTIIATGHYSDAGRMGDYIIATPGFDTTLEYYSGHLTDVKVTAGDTVKCGDILGKINEYNHTHIQVKRNGHIIDPESVLP